MSNSETIQLTYFCKVHSIEITFIEELGSTGLVEIIEEGNERFLRLQDLAEIERCLRLHLDLNLNVEAIETVTGLTELVRDLKQEIKTLQAQLKLYED